MLAQRTDIQEKDCLMTFEEIYQEYGDRILNLAYRMIGREDAARDLTQDIFIKVYENLASFRGTPRFIPGSTGSPPITS